MGKLILIIGFYFRVMDKATQNHNLTYAAFLWTSVLRAPFWAIYSLLLVILYKDLHASSFQIALFIALKPVVSIFSMYWGAVVNKRPDRLLSNVVWAGVIGFLPFLLFPLFYNPWYVLFASALYMTMHRGVVPAWMEIFKRNLPGGAKHKVFSRGSTISYVVGALLPLVIGPLLDHYPLCWRWIFVLTALMGMGAIFAQYRIPIELKVKPETPSPSFKEHFILPWQNAWKLLSTREDFRAYQIGFMVLGGCGLMIIQPCLPRFFIDGLGLSYTELAIALTLCKSVGFLMASSILAKAISRVDFYRVSSLVTLLGALFPIILLAAKFNLVLLYLAYLAYGIMQAGSELGWHLSGPIFAKTEDSSAYSSVNVLTVGMRGLVVPQIGSLLCLFGSSTVILVIGSLCCLVGTSTLLLFRSKSYVAKQIIG